MWDKCAQYIKKIGTVILLSTIVIWFLSYYPRPEEGERLKVKAESFDNTSCDKSCAVQTPFAPHGSRPASAVKAESEVSAVSSATGHGLSRQSCDHVDCDEMGLPKVKIEEEPANGINENSFIAMIGHAVEPVLEPLGQNWRSSIALITSIPAKELVVSTLGVLYSSDSEENIQQDLRRSGDFTPRSAAAFLVFILLFFPCIATIAAIASETGSKKWAIFSIVYNTAVAWVAGFLVYTIGGMF